MRDNAGSLKYRPDIDGLRAIAVSIVVFNHARVAGFSGGYTGVDVFFAISGFLITSILLRDLGTRGRISYFDFYERRIRRLLPALYLVLAATTAACVWLMPPLDLKQYGASLGSTVLFASNFYFLGKTGYFAAPAASQPLLHTWSLAVEEQFYLLWPTLLVFFRDRRARAVIIGLGIASLAVAEMQLQWSPEAAFYMLPSRICEFALGAALAMMLPLHPIDANRRQFIALAGLLMIIASTVLFDVDTRFPGLRAMLPSLGAVMIIAGGPDAAVSRLLATQPIRFIGKISYSLYLWHWPVLVLPVIAIGRQLSGTESVLAMIASVALASASWYFVEVPCRRDPATEPLRFKMSAAMWAGLTLSLALVIVAQSIVWTNGLAFRGDARFTKLEAEVADVDPLKLGKDCMKRKADLDVPPCEYGKGPRRMVVWGDSHANHFGPSFKPWAVKEGVTVEQIATPGCPPVVGVDVLISGRLNHTCVAKNELVLKKLASWPDIETVVLAARWSLYTETVRAPAESDVTTHLSRLKSGVASVDESRRALRIGLENTISQLEKLGKHVVLVGQVPEFQFDAGKCFTTSVWFDRTPQCDQTRDSAMARLTASVHILEEVASSHKDIALIEPHEALCDQRRCMSSLGADVPLYHDFDHLSEAGARRLSGFMSGRLKPEWVH